MMKMARMIPLELDFIHEGHNAETIGANFSGVDDIVVPRIYWEHSTRRVLVMEYVEGVKITDVEGMRRLGVEPPDVAKILVVAFYPQPVTLDLSAVVRGDITIFTTRGEGGNNVKRAVSLAAQGRLRGAELVTHEFPLDDIAEAFRVMRERDGDPIKIVIIP